MRVCKKCIAAILCLVLFWNMIVASAQSAGEPDSGGSPPVSTESYDVPPASEEEAASQPDIIAEETGKREESVKHFYLSDGSYLAAQYSTPVHFEENGQWVDYDNSMTAAAIPLADPEADPAEPQFFANDPEDNAEYQNSKSDLDIRLARHSGNNMVKIKADGHFVSWGFEGISKRSVVFVEPELPEDENERKMVLPDLTQEARYEDAFLNVDLQYIIMPGGVKENVLLKNAGAQNEFTIQYKINHLFAVQTDSRTIELLDEDGKAVYVLSAPAMTDASGAFSEAVSLSIVSQKDKQLTVRLTADASWLAEEERQYPVVVDPSFTTSRSYNELITAWISSGKPTQAQTGTQNLYVGYAENGYKKTRAMVRMRTLPTLSPGDVIIHSRLTFYESACLYPTLIYAHRITSNWSADTLTWNNPASYNSTKLDYDRTNGLADHIGNTNQVMPLTWELTSLVRGWYEGTYPNYGVMLMSPSENSTVADRVQLVGSQHALANARPVFQIQYRNNAGLESYWTYHEQSFSNGTTAYINDYSGNLVIQTPLASTAGSRMPYSLSMTFNAYMAHQYYRQGNKGHITGYGNMTTNDQRIDHVNDLPGLSTEVKSALVSQGYQYAYTDADGTVHYFKAVSGSTNTYEDEDGLNLTLKTGQTSANLFILESKTGEKIEFNSGGYILRMLDTEGNAITWSYSGRQLQNVTDGAGKVTTFGYSSEYNQTVLRSITNPAGEITELTYSTGFVSTVTYPDGTAVEFTRLNVALDGTTYVLPSRITDEDGTYVQYAYETGTNNVFKTRVKSVTEYAADGTAGNSMAITYGRDNTRTFTYTRDGVITKETYTFDDFGRTVSILNADGSSSCYSYKSDGGKAQHKLSRASEGEKYVNNILRNSSTENASLAWRTGQWAATSCTHSVDSTVAYLGSKSLKVTQNDANPTRVSHYRIITGTSGTYTFSGYVKTQNVTGGRGAGLFVAFQQESTHVSTATVTEGITGTNDWQRISLTFTLPAGTTSFWVQAGLIEANGTCWFDCLQLEQGATVNDYNMLENSNFGSSGSWDAPTLQSGDGITGGRFRITGNWNENLSGKQTVAINRKLTAVNVSGKATASSVPLTGEDRVFCLCVEIYYADGSRSWLPQSFNAQCTGDQYLNRTVTIPQEKQNLVIDRINFYLSYNKNENIAYFDEVMMTFDETGTAYTYDNKGNPISAKDNASRNQTYTFNNVNELTEYTEPNNDSYSYFYGNTSKPHRLTAARSNQSGLGFSFTYDQYGNVVTTWMGGVNTAGQFSYSPLYMATETEYNSLGSLVTGVTDQRGQWTRYTVNDNTGLTSQAVYPNGLTMSYGYNSSHQPTSVSGGGMSVSYGYDSAKRLSSITRNGMSYGFTYNKFGNPAAVTVGNQTLSSNNWSNAGDLLSTTYGNGTVYAYTYDNYGRVTQVKKNNVLQSKRDYNAKGELARLTDSASGRTTEYTYDLIGRPVQSTTGLTVGGNGRIARTAFRYDTLNRLVAQDNTMPRNGAASNPRVGDFDYIYGTTGNSSGLIERVQMHKINRLSYEYNSLGQVTRRTYSTANKSTEYTYEMIWNNQRTSNLITSLNNAGEVLSYTYDVMGNISTIRKNGVLQESYQYDMLGQLTRADSAVQNKSFVYTYDAGGNLTAVKEYAYTTGTLGAVQSTVSYSYGNTDWRDLLTVYDGQSITYDVIGNPLTYRDGMSMTWSGRSLTGLTKDGQSISYAYDANGLRASKTVGGNTTTYYTSGGVKIGEYRAGTNTDVFYMHDEKGTVYGICINGITYYFICNAQGDVIGLYDFDGAVVARYTYDAWGKPLSVTDGSGNDVSSSLSHVANINPFRYRNYYYDTETGFYYLNSRYYDPEIGRFISADSQLNTVAGVLGNNLFAYCENNPVNKYDPTGHMATEAAIAATNWWNPAGWIAAAVLIAEIVVVGVAVYVSIEETAAILKNVVEAIDNILNTRDQSVYILTDPNDNDKVKYVGRTNDRDRREGEHKRDAKHPERKNYDMTVVVTGLSVPKAKVVEQALISAYTLSYLDNARREIAVGNLSGYQSYLGAVIEIFGSITEDELMNLMRR